MSRFCFSVTANTVTAGSMKFLMIILGLVVLVFGRKLFWLSIAIVGFFVGMEFTGILLVDQPTWVLLVGGLVAGLIGALLAVFFQRVAFILAGFFAGAYLTQILAQTVKFGGMNILFLVIGGVIGAIVTALLMDWAIIVLSSLVGAGLIVPQLTSRPAKGAIVFVVLVVIGILIQAGLMEKLKEE
jgi:MFS family permease